MVTEAHKSRGKPGYCLGGRWAPILSNFEVQVFFYLRCWAKKRPGEAGRGQNRPGEAMRGDLVAPGSGMAHAMCSGPVQQPVKVFWLETFLKAN